MNIKIECAHDKVVPIAKLKPHPANPNKHPEAQIALLAKIIKAQGWRNPIVVSNRSGLITKGHARLEAAKLIGTDKAPVDFQDYKNEKSELADMIADNRIAELAEQDRTMLRELSEQLDDGSFDMDLTGFDAASLEELMTATMPESDIDAEPQIDKADELRQKWGVERGQIWQLGEHRLMCGDSTSDDLKEMADKKCATFTDPPYGVSIVGSNGKIGAGNLAKNQTYRTIQNDDTTTTARKFYDNCRHIGIQTFLIWGGNYFADFLIPSSCWIVWDKREGMTSNNFADCEIAYCSRDRPARIYSHLWNGMIRRGDDGKKVHPTQKPVDLHSRMINDLIEENIILDGFVGSGTTIIACEQLGRKCRAMEIDPGYVAVSIQRWEDATGKIPQLLK